MGNSDQKIYRTFEEFEREELRRADTVTASVDEMIDSIFGVELDFGKATSSKRRASWDADDE